MAGNDKEARRQWAVDLVAQVREQWGIIPDEDTEDPENKYKRANQNLRRNLSEANKLLSSASYSNSIRFVYELIQNAEDNQYSRIHDAGQVPFLRFTLRQGSIIVDSNEDGFSERDFKAICSTGRSSKRRQSHQSHQRYIGEKGIGFKSVFKVAKYVHVQSEPFSFAFKYSLNPDDVGLDMVVPIQEYYEELPPDVQTRFTLTPDSPSGFEKRVDDLETIPDTLLLFLTKLRTLHVNIFRPKGGSSETTYSYHRDNALKVDKVVKKQRINYGEWTEQVNAFHLVKRTITDLPDDEARENINQADVVLAFPVDSDGNAVIEPQDVYSYLPLRYVGFSFLIQSDFITQANREDIFQSERNQALRQGVAETFRDAVLRFCKHESLQYQWMRYLPPDTVPDAFWKDLRPMILNLLCEERILRSRSGRLHCAAQLSLVPQDFKDVNGDPLFPDLEVERYLADGYQGSDLQALQLLGSSMLKWEHLVDRVAADLKRPGSRTKSPATDNNWHSRVAMILSRPFEAKGPKSAAMQDRLRSLPLVPIGRNKWVSGSSAYFPDTRGVLIPTDLGLNMVTPDAVRDLDRREFFWCLGVKECGVEHVVSLIRQRYKGWIGNLTIEQSISHLQYLYRFLPPDQGSLGCDTRLFTSRGALLHPDRIYFADRTEEYSPMALFSGERSSDTNSAPPRFDANFLPLKYIEAIPEEHHGHRKSWSEWLETIVGVRSYPRLVSNDDLSEDFTYILAHRSEQLVGLLQKHWGTYQPQTRIPEVRYKLRNCRVPSKTGHYTALKDLYVPTIRLKALANDISIDESFFLRMPVEPRDDYEEEQWSFLSLFGARFTDDLEFYLRALKSVVSSAKANNAPSALDPIFRIYKGIMRKCDTPEDVSQVREAFDLPKAVYLPATTARPSTWKSLDECVWDGPEWLESTPSLSACSRYGEVRQLFQVTLKLRNAHWTDFTKELRAMQQINRKKTNDAERAEKAARCYHHLHQACQEGADLADMRTAFDVRSLMFVPSLNSWHRPKCCVWADESLQIPGFESIRVPYQTLEDFFCDTLEVQRLSIPMLVDAIREISEWDPLPLDRVKEFATAISTMEPHAGDVLSLQSTKFLPVKLRGGGNRLVRPGFAFAIADRKEHSEAFAGKANMLDFSQAEIHSSKNFLLALGLAESFTSKAVSETTKVKEGIVSPGFTEDFCRKSYALFRCAAHFRSTKARGRDRSLLKLLQNATVYMSSSISKTMRMTQGPSEYTAESAKATSHLDHSDGQLKLYIPMDKQSREVCYLQELPNRVLEFLSLSDPAAEMLIVKILGSRSLDSVDDILERGGVLEIAGVSRPVEAETQVASIWDEIDAADRQQATPHAPESSTTNNIVIDLTPTGSEDHPVSVAVPPTETPLETAMYATLLDRLIDIGQKASLPLPGETSHCFCGRTTLNCADHHSEYPSMFMTMSPDRQRKIGAAGELFVYELLLNKRLPAFGPANWRSTIRKECRASARYADLEPWVGSETSDIVYADTHGELTKQLALSGYIDAARVTEHPTYYIEVKTTTRGCEEPFFMSGAQFKRMQRLTLVPGKVAEEVYLLVRVFDVEQEGVGVRVFVDPEAERRAGRLEFGVETWRVKQSSGGVQVAS